jgi:DHA2 family multidrug resistance protein
MMLEASHPLQSSRVLPTCGLMIATALQAADALIVNVALPQLERDLGSGVELGAWVITSYLCATAVAAPLTGWLRSRYGVRRLWSRTIGVFIVASLLCSAAPSGATLILFRVLQGAAGGVILPLSQAILLDIYPKQQHGRMLAVWGAALMVGPIIGPLAGGIATDLASWRLAFVINFPFGILAIWSMARVRFAPDAGQPRPVDGMGLVLLIVAIGALQLCLERGVGRSWLNSPELWAEGSLAAVAFGALLYRARRSGFSVFRLGVFKDINFALAAFYNFATSGLLFVTVVFLPALAEGPFGYDATLSGFTIVPRAAFMTLTMLVVGQLIGKIDYRILLTSGWLLMAAGLAILSKITLAQGIEWMVVGSTVQAVGAGMLFTPHSTLAFSTLAAGLRTDASGLYSLLRQLGFASGVALMTAILRMRIAHDLEGLPEATGALVASLPRKIVATATWQAYCECFGVMAIAALAVVPGVFLFRVRGGDPPGSSAS